MSFFISLKRSIETFFLLFCFHVNFRGNKIIGCLLDFEKIDDFLSVYGVFSSKRFYDSKHFSCARSTNLPTDIHAGRLPAGSMGRLVGWQFCPDQHASVCPRRSSAPAYFCTSLPSLLRWQAWQVHGLRTGTAGQAAGRFTSLGMAGGWPGHRRLKFCAFRRICFVRVRRKIRFALFFF